jgi:hypothetical protein
MRNLKKLLLTVALAMTFIVALWGIGAPKASAVVKESDCSSTEYFVKATTGTAGHPAECVSRIDHPRNSSDCPSGYSYVKATSILPAHCSANTVKPDDCKSTQYYVPPVTTGVVNVPAKCVNKVDTPRNASDCPSGYTYQSATTGVAAQPAKCVKNAATGGGGSGDTSGDDIGDDSASGVGDSCNTTADPLTWIVCPVIDMVRKGTELMDNIINHLMQVDTTQLFDKSTPSGQAYYTAWNSFRIFGVGIIVIAGLAMVISEALGLEIFDAYTVKKVMPRLVVAVIGISLSWWLLKFLAEATNDVGVGIRSLIYFPFRDMAAQYNGHQGFGTTLIELMVGAGGLLFLQLGGVISLLLTAGLAALIAFLVLIVRQIIIVFLILMAPLAIACYVMPGTERVYKLWWDSLAKGLMMFPIISAFIAAGQAFSVVAANNPSSDFGLGKVIAVIAYFLPYFALPFTFRLAGGAIATIGGLTNDRSRGAFDRLKNYRGNKVAESTNAMKTGNRFRSGNFAANAFNATTRNIANAPHAGMVPWKMRSRMQAASATHAQSELAEYMEKNADFGAIKGNDDYLQATMKNMGGGESESDWRRYLSEKGYNGRSLEQGVAQIRAAKRAVSNEVFDRAAVMANASTGTGWKEGGPAAMMESINEVAGDDRHIAASMLAQMRGMASQAGRLDLGGSGFGAQIGALEDMHEGKITKQEANKRVIDNTMFTKSAGEYARARGQAIQNIAPHMVERLQKAHEGVTLARGTGNIDAIGKAERSLAQEYAALDNLHDSLNHMAPENAQILADTVLSREVVPGVTVMEQIRRLQQGSDAMSRAYLDTRKSYDARQAQAEAGRPPEPSE